MNRVERTRKNVETLFHIPPAGQDGTDPEFMQILQRYLFGEVSETGSLDLPTRELITITVLTTLGTLPQLEGHVQAALNVGCSPIEIREAIYQTAPFLGFPRTLNAISSMNQVFRLEGIELPLPNQSTVTEESRYETGAKLQQELYGTTIADRYTYLPGEFSQAVPKFLTELAFGDFASRNGLTRKMREMLTLVLLASMGDTELQLKSHFAGALKAGNTKEELVAALVHASAYMGIPRLFNTLNACKDIISE
ncbi:MAG: carboxymuconolactone decarboxylase family protein [Candidatus Fournierella pullistercoris]|uniref:Carboxymuconolactone decarboxylase family protein n=1 Tax=Candidatus Allofournierella pullistercoris TaxID=2838597 RepID=A0A948T2E8_9FIRM|nr:carboxymuconolactone decarboxylase family protein [Candidatus Fournierella pullistercoris]